MTGSTRWRRAGRTSSTGSRTARCRSIFNTTEGWQSLKDSQSIRATALNRKVPYFTTVAASAAMARAIGACKGAALEVRSLQTYYSARVSLNFPDNSVRGHAAWPRGESIEERRACSMASEKVPMLAEGYRKLEDEAEAAERRERPQIVDAIEEARAHGDLSENAEYHAAKERQGQVEAQIADIEDRLSRAMVIDPTTLSGDKVVFGATVNLVDENDKPIRYQMVGQTEADAKVGRISYN